MNETTSHTQPENLARRLSISLATLRITLGGFLFVCGLEKLLIPAKAVSLYKKFYFLDVPHEFSYGPGVLECLPALAVIFGIYRAYSYGAAFVLHLITVVFTIHRIIDPWGFITGNPQHLFLASIPVLAAFFVLYWLRDWDTYTLDARRAAG